jgi:hypothetical protein
MKTGALLLAVAGCGIAAVTVAVAADPQKPKAAMAAAATSAASPTTLVYYFHATTRCATCRTIEAYAHETVASRFATDIEARRLEWRTVNVDEPANQHFVRDFQLYTRSVVVVDAKDSKRYKILDRVWQLVGNKTAFQSYVEREIRAFPRL